MAHPIAADLGKRSPNVWSIFYPKTGRPIVVVGREDGDAGWIDVMQSKVGGVALAIVSGSVYQSIRQCF